MQLPTHNKYHWFTITISEPRPVANRYFTRQIPALKRKALKN